MTQNYKTQHGFTLLEVIIAMGILSIGVLSALALATFVLSINNDLVDRFHAVHFAQEGVEMVRAQRDTNWMRMNNGESIEWTDGLIDGTANERRTAVVTYHDPNRDDDEYTFLDFGNTNAITYAFGNEDCTDNATNPYDCTQIWFYDIQTTTTGRLAELVYFQTAGGDTTNELVNSTFDFDIYETETNGDEVYDIFNFTRMITLQPICRDTSTPANEVIITDPTLTCSSSYEMVGINVISQVQWERGDEAKSYVAETQLYDWQN